MTGKKKPITDAEAITNRAADLLKLDERGKATNLMEVAATIEKEYPNNSISHIWILIIRNGTRRARIRKIDREMEEEGMGA